jgi:hypothetical protein
VLDLLQHQISLNDVQTRLAAVEYTPRLAQHGVPTNALLRAFRLGHERFFEYCLDELGRQTVANDVLFSATGPAHPAGLRLHRPRLRAGRRLSLPPDAFQLLVAGRYRPPRVAVGEAGYGLDGLRATHHQALRAQSVALISRTMDEPVIRFAEVGALAMMSADLDAARVWVRRVLGALAGQDDQHARLRDTLRVFLAEGASYKATAERLMLHENTVQYRVRRPSTFVAGAGMTTASISSCACRLSVVRSSGPRAAGSQDAVIVPIRSDGPRRALSTEPAVASDAGYPSEHDDLRRPRPLASWSPTRTDASPVASGCRAGLASRPPDLSDEGRPRG